MFNGILTYTRTQSQEIGVPILGSERPICLQYFGGVQGQCMGFNRPNQVSNLGVLIS